MEIEKVLMKQLEKKGIELSIIPRFIKDIANSYLDNPTTSLIQLNDYLERLGWNSIPLDYRTYELFNAYLDRDAEKIKNIKRVVLNHPKL